MSVVVAIAGARIGLVAADTRHILPDSAEELLDDPTRSWKHEDWGGKVIPWTADCSAGFSAVTGLVEWGALLERGIYEREPRTFDEARECIPDLVPAVASTALSVGPGPDGSATLEVWQRHPDGERVVTPVQPNAQQSACVYVGAGLLGEEMNDALGERLCSRVEDARGKVPAFLEAIGRYVLETAEQTYCVSRVIDIGLWRRGTGFALRYPAEELVRIGKASRWSARDFNAGLRRFAAAYRDHAGQPAPVED